MAVALFLWATGAGATEVLSVFPSDRLTVADPTQLTGRRMALPLPPCARDPSGCDEVRLLNELDGFSVNPRIAIRFSGPIALGSVTGESAFVVPLWADPMPSPVGLVQLVWEPEGRTLHARPARPLLQGRRYALVVTSGVKDENQRPLQPGRGAKIGSPSARPSSVEAQLIHRLRELGIGPSDIVALGLFTTQSVTAGLEAMRALVDSRPARPLRFDLGPGGARSAYLRGELEGVEFRRQIAAGPGTTLADPVKLPLALLPPSEIRTVAFGRFHSLSFLTDGYIRATPTRSASPRPVGEEDVHVTVFLPEGSMPATGWPVAIFGHGFGNDRHLIPPLVAATMARHGLATVAINVVGHGGGPEGTLTVLQAGREPAVLPAGGRGVDRDGDGRIGSTEGVGTDNRGPLAVISSRDGLRQTVADLMQLVRAIRRGVDVDGDGRLDLDGDRIYYFGHSFGGIYGTLLMAIDPLLPVGVLNVPGGPLVEVARQAAVFRSLVVEQLRRRRPPLMNGEKDFSESIPLFGEPPVSAPVPGALAIQAFFDRVEWVSQAANPVAFAPYLREAPLRGLSPKAVLYQVAVGDLTVPNPTTASILRAGLLDPVVSVYRHDRLVGGLPERFKNPHSFLIWTGLPDVAPVARAAQEQVARFFLSGGRQIERTEARFEVGSTEALGR